MSLFNQIKESFFRFFSYDIGSYCKLSTVLDERTFITTEGGLATFILIKGVSGYADEEESKVSMRALHDAMRTSFSNADQSFHFTFTQDPDTAEEFVYNLMEAYYATLKRLQLESLSDLLDSDAKEMGKYFCSEWCILGIFTHPSILSSEDLKRSAKERTEYIKNNNVPLMLNCQNPFNIEMDLCNPNNATLDNVISQLISYGVMAEIMNTSEVLLYIKKELEPDLTSNHWKPTLITDLIKNRNILVGKNAATTLNDQQIINNKEMSHMLPMPILMQIRTMDHEIISKTKLAGSDVVKIGKRYYTPIVIEEAPEQITRFAHLLYKINGEIPFRISYEIRRGGHWNRRGLLWLLK